MSKTYSIGELKQALIKQKIFERCVAPAEGIECKLKDIEIQSRGGQRRDRVSKKSKSCIYSVLFKANGKKIPVVLKQTGQGIGLEESRINYESRVYGVIKRAGLEDLFVKCYDHMHDPDALLLAYYGKTDFSDFFQNTLEDELVRLEKEIRTSKSESDTYELRTERKQLFRDVSRILAKIHYNLTRQVLSEALNDQLNNKGYHLIDKDGKKWNIPVQTVKGMQERVIRNACSVLEFLSSGYDLFKSKDEFRKYVEKFKDIFDKGKNTFFGWINADPKNPDIPMFVNHGDLHGRQILLGEKPKDKDKKRKIKVIDLKNTIYASAITDFGFLESYACHTDEYERRTIFSDYLDYIGQLVEKDNLKVESAMNIKDKMGFNKFDFLDLARQFTWNMIIAGNICDYPKMWGFRQQLWEYLTYTGKSLDKLAYREKDFIGTEYAKEMKNHLGSKISYWV